MNVESGEYFYVTRGILLNDIDTSAFWKGLFCNDGDWWKMGNTIQDTPIQKEPHYDRSWADCVFIAKDVNYPVVAAECVYVSQSYKQDYVGKTFVLNLTEIEIMTLTKNFVKELNNGR